MAELSTSHCRDFVLIDQFYVYLTRVEIQLAFDSLRELARLATCS